MSVFLFSWNFQWKMVHILYSTFLAFPCPVRWFAEFLTHLLTQTFILCFKLYNFPNYTNNTCIILLSNSYRLVTNYHECQLKSTVYVTPPYKSHESKYLDEVNEWSETCLTTNHHNWILSGFGLFSTKPANPPYLFNWFAVNCFVLCFQWFWSRPLIISTLPVVLGWNFLIQWTWKGFYQYFSPTEVVNLALFRF